MSLPQVKQIDTSELKRLLRDALARNPFIAVRQPNADQDSDEAAQEGGEQDAPDS